MTYEYADTDDPICKAALNDNYEVVRVLFEATPELMIKPVNKRLETPLMIAVGTNRSNDFVEQLLKNVGRLTPYQWCGVNRSGNSALHYAAMVGNIKDAKLMVQCLPVTITRIKNNDGDIPAILAAKQGRRDMFHDVFTEYDVQDEDTVDLIIPAIQAGLLDLALAILYLIILPDEERITCNALHALGIDELQALATNALQALATKPEFFPSGNRLGFCGGIIYRWMLTTGIETPAEHAQGGAELLVTTNLFSKMARTIKKLKSAFEYVKTWAFKNIQDIKIKNEQSNAIVKKLCQIMSEVIKGKRDPDIASMMLGPAIATAVEYGTVDLIEECILAYPGLLSFEFKGNTLFHLAIEECQVQVYNLTYQMSGHKVLVANETRKVENGEENALHIAAKLAPSCRLSTITGGPALELQSELQRYKEVETFVGPLLRVAKNGGGKTPQMVFKEEHKYLLKDAQKWMKDRATSCTVVAALVMTITFAAAITVPGGNKDDGKPIFLNERAFMLFMISDAIALYSSSTSLLMFLGILTSRYAEDDFLYTLPNRLTIGLVSLFLSIAATMIAFGATLALLLHDKVTWIAPPLVMITSIPVGLFALLQFPLLVKIVWSTYGPSIFRKQSSRMIY